MVNRMFEMYSCDGNSCESLEGLVSEYRDRYNAGSETGTRYTFEHDSTSSKNRFACSTKQFSNVDLKKAGWMLGDNTQAQSDYICATGGQNLPCAAGMGEVVHHVDTCGTGIRYHDIEALKAKLVPENKWKDLTTLHNKVFGTPGDVSSVQTGSSPGIDCAVSSSQPDCEVYSFYRSLQQYPMGCGRKLKMRVLKGVSGQVVLRVIVRNYNTAVNEADPEMGYTYWTAAMLPVSVTAKVKPVALGDNIGRSSSVATSVNEKGSLQFLGTGALYSPFGAMHSNGYTMSDEATRVALYSRSTRTHLEIIECTTSHLALQVESDQQVPRFRLSTNAAFDGYSFGGNYRYNESYRGEPNSANRIYELSTLHSYDAPTVLQLQTMVPLMTLRAQHDAVSPWWTTVNPALSSLDSYHEGYSNLTGICLISRMYAFEPSSCDYSVSDSAPYYIHAVPVNADANPTVEFMQSTRVWGEDETVPLKIKVQHPGSNDDSKMWYFSHVEIEDMNYGAHDLQNGGNFDLFSYGHTIGESYRGINDTVLKEAGISKLADGRTWRSFANKCTRWIYEQDQFYKGGFSSDYIDHQGFVDSEACLQDARRQGELIWGTDGTSSLKTGVFMRPYRKMTKNVKLKVTLYMYDGDAFGWHSADSSLRRIVVDSIELLHVPATTRYNQREILQVSQIGTENSQTVVEFNAEADRTGGLGVPLPYRSNSFLCTYVRTGNSSDHTVDEFSQIAEDRDKACNADGLTGNGFDILGGTTCPSGRCFGFATDTSSGCSQVFGHRVSCRVTGAEQTRAQMETIVVFDESQGSNNAGTVYADGSAAWVDGPMTMPEQITYQPAGNNKMAPDNQQWYRLQPCPTVAAVSAVYWCNNASAVGIDTLAGTTNASICDVVRSGAAADPAGAPGSVTSVLMNSLSTDKVSGAILTNGILGYTENFWILQRASVAGFLQRGSLCFQGQSDFNTEDRSWSATANSPVNLRLVVVTLDRVTAAAGVDVSRATYSARSKSNTDQGAFNFAVKSVRQPVQGKLLPPMWKGRYPIDGNTPQVSFVEERNDATRAHVDTQLTWSNVAALVGGTLQPDLDCGAGNFSDTFCADRIRWNEMTDFHDQHLGRVEIKGYFQKTCGANKMPSNSWLPAGGLFDAYVQYVDDYIDYGDQKPGHGFDLNGGAGYRVSDSGLVACDKTLPGCAATILSQNFTMSDHGTQIQSDVAGGSICRIQLDGDMDAFTTTSVRATSCHIHDAYDVVGHNTFTWSDTILNRVVVNKCHKPIGGAGLFTCPAGVLAAREIASNLRFRLPHRWSNCVRFKFEVSVSNDDRVKPSFSFETGSGSTFVSYKSGPVVVYVEPQPRAEEPVMWIDTELADSSGCIGSSDPICAGKTGTQAIGNISGQVYKEIDSVSNLNGNDGEAMMQLTMVAGYRTQLRILATSGATDVQSEGNAPQAPLQTSADYKWDSMRAQYNVSGEHVYLTVVSKYNKMVPGKPAQRFCLWMCSSSTPAGQGCDKSGLIRVRALPETGEDFSQSNVNCAPCTGSDADGCIEYGVKLDGTPLKCKDNYGRDTTLLECPSFSEATPYHNPASRYSIKCSKTGDCPELKNLYVQYPADQIEDDVLEFSAWSRADWRGAAGFQRSTLSMNILMKPSITLSSVGFDIEESPSCDTDTPGVYNCSTGSYGVPLQPRHIVTVVPAVYPPVILSLQEAQLHGVSGAASVAVCASLGQTSDLTNTGSAHPASTDCGIRFPISAKDSTLMAVAPVGIKFSITAGAGIEPKNLAQAVQMLCTTYAKESTGATNDCVGHFTAINPVSAGAEHVEMLRFQSSSAAVQPDPVTRLLDWSNYQESSTSASYLSWNVGSQMAKKEMVLFGSDSNPYSLSDYSFDNNKCENDRFFTVELVHQTGYSPSVVVATRSSVSVKVEDDDFYGKIQLAGVSNNKLFPLSDLPVAFRSANMSKLVWNADGMADTPFSAYLVRSRRKSESDSEAKRLIDMKPLRVWVKVDLGGLNTNEFTVDVIQVHGVADADIQSYTLSAAQVVQGDGQTQNMIYVDFPAAQTQLLPGQHDCKACGNASNTCYFYTCDSTEGDPSRDVPFQFFKISFKAAGQASGCNEGIDKNIVFNIHRVEYTAAAGTALQGEEITCGTDTARNPLELSESLVTFTQTLAILAEDPRVKSPFRVSFAGFSPGIEGLKQQPLAWNAGLDMSYIGITETEHNECFKTGTKYACNDRKFRMHLCSTLRDTELNAVWNTWEAGTFRFFANVVESPDAWSQVGNFYNLKCPSDVELSVMSAASSGGQVQCNSMSSIEKITPLRSVPVFCDRTHPDYLALTPTEQYTYCGDHVPKRLMWTMNTDQNGGRNAFKCPTVNTQALSGADNPWTKIPYIEFNAKDDGGVVNLSRRPKLCIQNGGLPESLIAAANTETCSSISAVNCVDLRIQDDELFAQDNTLLDRDMNTMEASFSEPVWDSVAGKLKLYVTDRYYHSPQERTLVNVGIGSCEPEVLANPASAVDLRSFWEQYDGSLTNNPITAGTTAFGSCDLLHHGHFPQGKSNAEMFVALFGPNSAQPDLSKSSSLGTAGRLFGFNSTEVNGQNTLFTEPRDMGAGGRWQVKPVTIDTHGNADLSTVGFEAELSVSLERLQNCMDRTGRKVVNIKQVDSNTVYEFTISSTHVTAMRKDDSAYAHYSPTCTERMYSLSVSNSMFALSGLSTSSTANAIYVDSVGYKSPVDNVCTSAGDCVANKGPAHTCPNATTYNLNTLKLMEYTVNMDMRTVSNVVAGTTVTSFYGPANLADIVVDPNNCYGAAVHSVVPLSASTVYIEPGVTRTRITFRTACTELRTHQSGAFGLPVADAFATCSSAPQAATDFSFMARIWECSNQNSLLSPTAASSGCQLKPDWLRVSIAIAFTENPKDVSYQVKFESTMSMYQTFDHRLPDGSYPSKSARETWRTNNVLTPTTNDPYVNYPVDAMLTASLGFSTNSALEAVMTTAIRQVRLCRFKKFCHLPSVSTAAAGAALCSWDNVMNAGTHSPMANYARNPTLDGGPGCAESDATTRCGISVRQQNVKVPLLTCDRAAWEKFAVTEAKAYVASGVFQSAFLDNIIGGTGKALQVATIAMAFDPTIEGLLMVDHGSTTALAESIYGNCEKHLEHLNSEDIIDTVGSYGTVTLRHIMPKAPADGSATGVCTCKGQRAHEFTKDGGSTFPFRSAASRKVVYQTDYYDQDDTKEASLHKCTWLNAPQHSTSQTPLNSVDQFTMSLRSLRRAEEYFFEINAVQFDHQAFTAQQLSSTGTDQFGTGASAARRMLTHTESQQDDFNQVIPRAAIAQAARLSTSSTPKGRHLLALMVPVSNVLTTHAVMPQGQVSLKEQDSSGSMASSGTGGFVVTGDPSSMAAADLQNNLQNSAANPFRYAWELGLASIQFTFLGLDIMFAGDWFSFSDIKWRTSWGLGPMVGLLFWILELIVVAFIGHAAMHRAPIERSALSNAVFDRHVLSIKSKRMFKSGPSNTQKFGFSGTTGIGVPTSDTKGKEGEPSVDLIPVEFASTISAHQKNTKLYSKTFFKNPAFCLDYSWKPQSGSNWQHAKTWIGIFCNELHMTFGGYYLCAILLAIPMSLISLLKVAGVPICTTIRSREPELDDKGEELEKPYLTSGRYAMMRFVSHIFDDSLTERFIRIKWFLFDPMNMKKHSQLNWIEKRSLFVWLPFIIALRSTMAGVAMFMVPLSLLAAPVYAIIQMITLMFRRTPDEKNHVGNNATTFNTHNTEQTPVPATPDQFSAFPWGWQPEGGYKEFGDIVALWDNLRAGDYDTGNNWQKFQTRIREPVSQAPVIDRYDTRRFDREDVADKIAKAEAEAEAAKASASSAWTQSKETDKLLPGPGNFQV